MKKKQKAKGSLLENLGLGQKMSIIIGILTFLLLLALLFFLIHSFRLSMYKKVDANMADKSAQASYDLEDLMTKLNATANNIEESISFVFDQHDEVGGFPEILGLLMMTMEILRRLPLWKMYLSGAVW